LLTKCESYILILNTHSSNGDGNIPSLTILVIPEGQVYVLDSDSLRFLNLAFCFDDVRTT